MKKAIILLPLIFCYLITFATIITVDNNPNGVGQYTDLQEAIDAAEAGDTIYVSGSETSYGNVDISIKLTLIGAGFDPNNQFHKTSIINTIYFKEIVTGLDTINPSGSTFHGLNINLISAYANSTVNNIIISRNEISIVGNNGSANASINNWIIINNIIRNAVITDHPTTNSTASNIIIANNIFTTGRIIWAEGSSILVTNNLFIRREFITSSSVVLQHCDEIIISNNIFYGQSVGLDNADCNSCIFSNNISFNSEGTDFNYGTNSGNNNFENTDPEFSDDNGDLIFDRAENYALTDESPGKGAGTDGTDIGIYGGIYPFPPGGDSPYLNSPFPSIPQLLEMNINNSAVIQDGTLNVDFKAKSAN